MLFIDFVTVNNIKMKIMENCRKLNLIVVISKEKEIQRTYGSLTTLKKAYQLDLAHPFGPSLNYPPATL